MKKISTILGIIFYLTISNLLFAQSSAINISLTPINIENLGGRQSFAVGQANGKWLIIGGRTDGLHRRQPFASFDINGQPNELLVIDPVSKQKWTANLSVLPIAIQEALKATNTDFIQNNNQLYLIGGYGYSNTLGDHTTFNTLTAIAVSETIAAIISNSNFSNYFRQTSNNIFQNTGGQLEKINDTYYLVGGQDFQGRYNPSGPTHGPGFTQIYSNQIRKFKIIDNGIDLSINNIVIINDSVNLHRRDYNALPQILPNLNQGITAYSGVFQQNVDLPYLNSVTIDSLSHSTNNSFNQYYNHYHCANIPLYAASKNEMHALFFGGIAQFYDSLGILVQDNNAPFVKTIARVTRDANGSMAEYKLPIEMPAFLGAGAEFIYNENMPTYTNGVIKMDELSADSTVLGYIYGGINSSAKNIFWINDGSQSTASANIYKVTLHKNSLTGIDRLNNQSVGSINLMVYPNPNTGIFTANYHLIKNTDVKITLRNVNGKIIEEQILLNQQKGAQVYERKIRRLENGGVYFIDIETAYENVSQKIIIEP